VVAPLNFDVMMYRPTLKLDGEKVIEDREMRVES